MTDWSNAKVRIMSQDEARLLQERDSARAEFLASAEREAALRIIIEALEQELGLSRGESFNARAIAVDMARRMVNEGD